MKTEENLCHANPIKSQDKIEMSQNKIIVYNIAQRATRGRKEGYLEKAMNRVRGVKVNFVVTVFKIHFLFLNLLPPTV
jgi:hypothetical protein